MQSWFRQRRARLDHTRRDDDMHALWPLYCAAASRSVGSLPCVPFPNLTADELMVARFRFLHYVLHRPWWTRHFMREELVAFCAKLAAEDREPLSNAR